MEHRSTGYFNYRSRTDRTDNRLLADPRREKHPYPRKVGPRRRTNPYVPRKGFRLRKRSQYRRSLLSRSRRAFRSPLSCLQVGNCPRRIQTPPDLERRPVPRSPRPDCSVRSRLPCSHSATNSVFSESRYEPKGIIRTNLSGNWQPAASDSRSCTTRLIRSSPVSMPVIR